MAFPEPVRSPAYDTPPPPTRNGRPTAAPSRHPGHTAGGNKTAALGETRTWLTLLAALALVWLCCPQTWGCRGPGLWFPPAGLALVVAAWLGVRCLLLVAANLVLVSLVAGDGTSFLDSPADALLTAVEAGAGWWCYRRLAGG